jgi:hypothetical protein
MEKHKHTTKIITDLSQVPEGYTRLSEIASRDTKQGKIIHKFLSDAQMNGQVRAVKLVRTMAEMRTGLVFVQVDDAEAFIKYRQMRPIGPRVEKPAASPDPRPVTIDSEALIVAMDGLRYAIVALNSNVRDLQAAIELRIEKESGQYA